MKQGDRQIDCKNIRIDRQIAKEWVDKIDSKSVRIKRNKVNLFIKLINKTKTCMYTNIS